MLVSWTIGWRGGNETYAVGECPGGSLFFFLFFSPFYAQSYSCQHFCIFQYFQQYPNVKPDVLCRTFLVLINLHHTESIHNTSLPFVCCHGFCRSCQDNWGTFPALLRAPNARETFSYATSMTVIPYHHRAFVYS